MTALPLFCALLAVVGGCAAQLQRSSPWPQFRAQLDRRGAAYLPDIAAPTHNRWSLPIDGGAASSAVISASGSVYFGGEDHCLHAVAANGNAMWQYDVGVAVKTTPALTEDGSVLFGAGRSFYALDANSGRVRWIFTTASPVSTSSPAVDSRGRIYFGTDNGQVYSLTAAGKQRWRYATRGKIAAAPTVSDVFRTLYIGSADGYMYALGFDGRLRWRFHAVGGIVSAAVLSRKNDVYFGSLGGRFYHLAKDGSMVWSTPLNRTADVRGSVAVGERAIYVGSPNGLLTAILLNGTVDWQLRMAGAAVEPVVVLHDAQQETVLLACADGQLRAMSADGQERWALPIADPSKPAAAAQLLGSPTLTTDNRVVLVSTGGAIAISTLTSEEKAAGVRRLFAFLMIAASLVALYVQAKKDGGSARSRSLSGADYEPVPTFASGWADAAVIAPDGDDGQPSRSPAALLAADIDEEEV